jgi:hypothetical protein
MDLAAHRPSTLVCSLTPALALLLAGCGSSGTSGSSLRPDDFVNAAPALRDGAAPAAPSATAAAPASTTRTTDPASPKRPPMTITGPVGASEGIIDVVASPGSPAIEPGAGTPVAASVFIDAKIGDINNKAVYASAFLDPMIDRLAREWEELQKTEGARARVAWAAFSRSEIQRKLETMIEDEVLRAEALSDLDPDMKQGLRSFMENVQNDLIRQNRGSRVLTEEKLRDSEGVGLDDYMKQREQQELIRYKLGTRIYKRINVSWRDIKLAYEKNYELFNPPPTAVFRLILVAADRNTDAEKVTSELAAGKPFAEVAALPINGFRHEDGGMADPIKFSGEFSSALFFGGVELNQAARSLTPGVWAGPVPFNRRQAWIYLETITKIERPLYDAQLLIENALRDTRGRIERYRYIERLKQRASFTDIDEMTERLMRIAGQRVLPPNLAIGIEREGIRPGPRRPSAR